MTDIYKAAQQALEALVQIHPGNMTPMAEEAWNKAIVMLGDALAEQPAEQESVYLNPDIEYMAEEAECVAMCLNDRSVPNNDGDKSLSLWGRVEQYANPRFLEGMTTNGPEISHDHIVALARIAGLLGAYTTAEFVERVVGFARVLLNNKAVQEQFIIANSHLLYTAPQPAKPADQEPVRGEWQGYTWNPYAISQPKAEQEPVEATPYTLKRIAWELERTALGDGFYGNALRVAKDIPGITPEDRSVLDRYATGTQTCTDHVHLQWLAQRLYNKDDRELLELAAKAANVDVRLIKRRNTAVCEGDDYYEDLPEDRWYFVLKDFHKEWNPLTDDGDALRLASKCNLNVCMGYGAVSACLQDDGSFHRAEEIKDDPYAATRRAIVRSAAEIGRNTK